MASPKTSSTCQVPTAGLCLAQRRLDIASMERKDLCRKHGRARQDHIPHIIRIIIIIISITIVVAKSHHRHQCHDDYYYHDYFY